MQAAMIVWDGLRPEFVRPDLTPTLCALSERGTFFEHHQAVFPTETRVNSSSLATGCTPDQHGMVANRFWDREMSAFVNTGDHEDLDAIRSATGRVLAVPTVCERLRNAGRQTLAVGSGSPGSTLLQDPEEDGAVVNTRGVVRPDRLAEEIVGRFGPFPDEASAPDGWNDLACRVFIDAIERGAYDFGVLWMCDPDYTQHKQGLGSEHSLAAIRATDARLARILDAAPSEIDLVVASDHGFSTVDRSRRASDGWLGLDEDRAWMGSSGVYLADPERDLERVVDTLKGQSWVGPVFTEDAGKGPFGVVDETYSKNLVHAGHPTRSPDVVFSRRWTDETNAFGIEGGVWGPGGIATHGSLSPYDRRCVLIGSGRSFRQGVTSALPSSAVDVAPTILSLFGIEGDCSGRVLVEGLSGEAGDAPQVEASRLRGVGEEAVVFSHVHGRTYLEGFER